MPPISQLDPRRTGGGPIRRLYVRICAPDAPALCCCKLRRRLTATPDRAIVHPTVMRQCAAVAIQATTPPQTPIDSTWVQLENGGHPQTEHFVRLATLGFSIFGTSLNIPDLEKPSVAKRTKCSVCGCPSFSNWTHVGPEGTRSGYWISLCTVRSHMHRQFANYKSTD